MLVASENEALAIMQAAQQFVQMGKYEKASKLFEHAFLMQPRHPDILTEYGLFTEKVRGDVVKANLMYCAALIYNPEHSLAIFHRGRTQPLVQEADAEMLRVLDHDQRRFLRIPRNNRALIRAMREAYFSHIYHTVAIEGNTMSLVQTRSLLETRLAIGGKSLIEHNEILGMDAALKYVNVSLVNRIGLLTVEDILEIHRRVYGFVDPVGAGHFRRHQVFVGDFEPTPEMAALIDWLNLDTTMRIHPVELAALLHYKFVVIHPFVDGNGRTARLLMNLVLMQAGFPPVIIRVEDRLKYYETLKIGNSGDIRPFIRFIAEATKRTLGEYLTEVDEDSSDGTLANSKHGRFVDDGRTILVN
ncbi:Adenosine monophosphate-protein transferase FICD [Trichuris trichiura]|uniref:protein adenylyltransferase n=1 Tax=Trichuris trichiura TaxID=36087 RepID=A0A077Z0U6_TRITR|nr:Adenosine monophosphate-protein transferase FICD [Trichuris trichiura]